MLAAEQGFVKVLEIRLAKGANINAVDQFEETALARAYHTNQTKAAQYLKSKGGRKKSERTSLSYYSTRDRDGKSSTKAALPQWSAAADDLNIDEGDSDEAIPGSGDDEIFEE
jgi:hypothetical protein